MPFKRKMEDGQVEVLSVERPPLNMPSPVRSAPGQRKHEGLSPRAVITADIHIYGSVQTEGRMEFEGQVNGDVRCGHLTIGKSATITGDTSADEVVIRGKVKGAIHARRIIIQAGAHVEGDISYDKLSIEEDAYFKGSSTPNAGAETGASEI